MSSQEPDAPDDVLGGASGLEEQSRSSELDEFLEASRERVDSHLDAVLPAETQHPAELHRAMRYAVFSGGKRVRPALAFGAALAVSADLELAVPIAGAVELVHACSLVLDDLPSQDDNPLRRGQAAVHIAFDHATAVLAGSALLVDAFAQLAQLADPAASTAVGARLTRTIGSKGLIGGQVDDLAFDPAEASLEEVEFINLRKTAALFSFSTWSGGLAGGCAGGELGRLDAFGRAYGLAFQIVDDLFDEDLDECSILHVLTREQARGRVHELVDEAVREVEAFGPNDWVLSGLARRLETSMS
ncbi:polyprenyl synthetase family protein [Candidatus Poriferisocius sp.]|uniref:polyprenyl synthetase family protein n=1 Tax=Candidatus Poriferisocius sp. TaxID=3101276 RepID=UPI003B51EFA0